MLAKIMLTKIKPAKNKSTILDIGHRVYECSLIFYPEDLRGDFGNEMIEVFDEQACEAYSRSGFLGLLCVWSSAMKEIVTVAVPRRCIDRAVPVVAVTATLAFMLWFASYIGCVMQTACSGCIVN